MWVMVKTNKNGKCTGVLDNVPVVAVYLKCGDEIEFEWFNVIDIIENEEHKGR